MNEDHGAGTAAPCYRSQVNLPGIGRFLRWRPQLAHQLIDVAAQAGCNAVKFQKRTPEPCVPIDQRDLPKEIPWGTLTYLEYRRRLEFGPAEYDAIAEHCSLREIAWFASVWDLPSVEFMERYDPPYHKIASAKLTDTQLLLKVAETKRPIILSTGMSTQDEVDKAMELLHDQRARTRTTCCIRSAPNGPFRA